MLCLKITFSHWSSYRSRIDVLDTVVVLVLNNQPLLAFIFHFQVQNLMCVSL